MTERSPDALRILISAESAADAGGAMRLATLIAGRNPAVLGGLLVLQDHQGARQFASQRIVAVSGQLLLAPDAEQQKRLVVSEAKAFQRMLARSATSVGAIWSADVRRGSLESQIAAEADAWDITIIGHRPLHRRRGAVVALSFAPEVETSVSRVAEHVAEQFDTVVEKSKIPGLDDIGGFLEYINRINALAVVLDAEVARPGGFHRIAELLAVARCPVILLRSRSVLPRLQHLVHIPSAKPEG